MLDFKMETFLTLCETMSYTRAAERLCITQPAVTQQIRHLEEKVMSSNPATGSRESAAGSFPTAERPSR